MEQITTRSAIYRRPIHTLSLLLASDEVPERPEAEDQTGDQTDQQPPDQTEDA